MVKNQTYGLILLTLIPFLKEIFGSTTPAPAKPAPAKSVTIAAPPKSESVKTEAISVDASVYFPVEEQTDDSPLITADGSKINENNPRKHRWVALSRNLLEKWGGEFDFGDSIHIEGISPDMDGVYVVRDAMHKRIRNRIDILVGSDDEIMGYWEDIKLTRLN